MLAVGGNSVGHVWLLDPDNGNELAALTPPGNAQVTGIVFSPDDHTLAVSHGRRILLWDIPNLRRQLASLGLDW
jgi:hypothetical protein